jgi:hypothetical protein
MQRICDKFFCHVAFGLCLDMACRPWAAFSAASLGDCFAIAPPDWRGAIIDAATIFCRFSPLNKRSTKPVAYGERFVKRRGLFCLTLASRYGVVQVA